MGIPRPAAEKLGVDRQDPDLDGLLLELIRRATGGCHEHAARANRPADDWVRKRVKSTLHNTFTVKWAKRVRFLAK